MKKSIFLHIAVISLLLLSCKKTDNNQYSFWYVNGHEYKTNDVKTDQGNGELDFYSNSFKNGFYFTFNQHDWPTYPSMKMDCSSQNPQWTCFEIIYNDTGYIAKRNEARYIRIAVKKNKVQFILDSSWLYNSYRPSEDSIFAYGTFNQP